MEKVAKKESNALAPLEYGLLVVFLTSNFGGSSSALQQEKQLILISSANSICMNPQSLGMCTKYDVGNGNY